MHLNKKIYNALKFLLGISGTLVVASIALYLIKFGDNVISSNPENWGQFGDFMGGVLNPLLALINICIFIVLTISIQNFADRNNDMALQTNRNIAIMSMKHEELSSLRLQRTSYLKDGERIPMNY